MAAPAAPIGLRELLNVSAGPPDRAREMPALRDVCGVVAAGALQGPRGWGCAATGWRGSS